MEGGRQTAEIENDKVATASNTVDCVCINCNSEPANFECLLCLKKGNRKPKAVFCSYNCYKQHFQQHRIETSSTKCTALSPRNSTVSSETSSSCCPDSPVFDLADIEARRKTGRRRRSSKTHFQSIQHHPQGYWHSPEWPHNIPPMTNTFPTAHQRVPLVQWMPQYLCWVMYP